MCVYGGTTVPLGVVGDGDLVTIPQGVAGDRLPWGGEGQGGGRVQPHSDSGWHGQRLDRVPIHEVVPKGCVMRMMGFRCGSRATCRVVQCYGGCRRRCCQKAIAGMVLHAGKCKPGGMCVSVCAVCSVLSTWGVGVNLLVAVSVQGRPGDALPFRLWVQLKFSTIYYTTLHYTTKHHNDMPYCTNAV